MRGTLTQFNSNGRRKIDRGEHRIAFRLWPVAGMDFGFTFIGGKTEDINWRTSVRVSQTEWLTPEKEMRFGNYSQVFGLVLTD